MTDPRKTSHRRQQVLQIAVLGLVWAVGVVALVFERSGSDPEHRARPAGSATAGRTAR